MSNRKSASKLHRTLPLSQALAIGIGTMVGAGIFVFPGIAISYVGPAAMLSFAIAAVIALLVAFSAAELSTSMPENGGAYYYVSRAMGPSFGMFVGIGQWFGLVFASAFYLVGFGRYAVELLSQLGFRPGDPKVLIATGTG
ncbi:MAG: amino acid permease, partial [Rhodohalobacter sp.]|uniref:APC family permease n=1 Tax=Rhodohalobacter sp. TaxID=1974210 RepID=UPI003974BCFC